MLAGSGNDQFLEVGNSHAGIDVVGEELSVHHQPSLRDGSAHQSEGTADEGLELGGREPVRGEDPVDGRVPRNRIGRVAAHRQSGDVAHVGAIRVVWVPGGADADDAEVSGAVVAEHDQLARPHGRTAATSGATTPWMLHGTRSRNGMTRARSQMEAMGSVTASTSRSLPTQRARSAPPCTPSRASPGPGRFLTGVQPADSWGQVVAACSDDLVRCVDDAFAIRRLYRQSTIASAISGWTSRSRFACEIMCSRANVAARRLSPRSIAFSILR